MGAWIETGFKSESHGMPQSRTLMGAWIETRMKNGPW